MKSGYRKVTCAECQAIMGFVSIQPFQSTIVKAYCENCYQQLR
ncbi:hypothetical protein [Candidatus Nitrososphaera sp. FF02]